MDIHQQVKVIGANGQISLGKEFAGKMVVIDQISDGTWIIKSGEFIPDSEKWLCSGLKKISQKIILISYCRDLKMAKIKIDMNAPEFQQDFFDLEKLEQAALIRTLKKIHRLTWLELYADKGLRWETILSKQSKFDERIYSFRFSQKYRATALRQGDFLRLLTLHADHDSAYKN
jgi:hypothetical protein